MDALDRNDGVDFFDFLYETWKAKWIILVVLVISAGIGTGWMMRIDKLSEAEEGRQIAFTLQLRNDPLMRDASALLVDFVGRVDQAQKLGLVFAGVATPGNADIDSIRERNSLTYEVSFVAGMNNGYILLMAKDGSSALYEQAYQALQAAAKEQAADAAKIAQGSLDVVNSATRFSNVPQLLADDHIMASVQFLATPQVQNGSFRFLALRNLETKNYEMAASASGVKKMLMAMLAGVALCVFIVMFRITLQRQATKV